MLPIQSRWFDPKITPVVDFQEDHFKLLMRDSYPHKYVPFMNAELPIMHDTIRQGYFPGSHLFKFHAMAWRWFDAPCNLIVIKGWLSDQARQGHLMPNTGLIAYDQIIDDSSKDRRNLYAVIVNINDLPPPQTGCPKQPKEGSYPDDILIKEVVAPALQHHGIHMFAEYLFDVGKLPKPGKYTEIDEDVLDTVIVETQLYLSCMSGMSDRNRTFFAIQRSRILLELVDHLSARRSLKDTD